MKRIYFLNLIFAPVVFSKQTLTLKPSNMYQLSKSIFGHIATCLVYEMWVSKVTTEDTSFFILYLLIPELLTRGKTHFY